MVIFGPDINHIDSKILSYMSINELPRVTSEIIRQQEINPPLRRDLPLAGHQGKSVSAPAIITKVTELNVTTPEGKRTVFKISGTLFPDMKVTDAGGKEFPPVFFSFPVTQTYYEDTLAEAVSRENIDPGS